jgi:hypothetical protein
MVRKRLESLQHLGEAEAQVDRPPGEVLTRCHGQRSTETDVDHATSGEVGARFLATQDAALGASDRVDPLDAPERRRHHDRTGLPGQRGGATHQATHGVRVGDAGFGKDHHGLARTEQATSVQVGPGRRLTVDRDVPHRRHRVAQHRLPDVMAGHEPREPAPASSCQRQRQHVDI